MQDQFSEIKQTFYSLIIYLDGGVDMEIDLRTYACSHTQLLAHSDCLYQTFLHFSFFKSLFRSFKTRRNLGIRNKSFLFPPCKTWLTVKPAFYNRNDYQSQIFPTFDITCQPSSSHRNYMNTEILLRIVTQQHAMALISGILLIWNDV